MPDRRNNLLFVALVLFLFVVVYLFSPPAEHGAQDQQHQTYPVAALRDVSGITPGDAPVSVTFRPDDAFPASAVFGVDFVSANIDSASAQVPSIFEGTSGDPKTGLGTVSFIYSNDRSIHNDVVKPIGAVTLSGDAQAGVEMRSHSHTFPDEPARAAGTLHVQSAQHEQHGHQHAHASAGSPSGLANEAAVKLASITSHLHRNRDASVAAPEVMRHAHTSATHIVTPSVPDRSHPVHIPHVVNAHAANPHAVVSHSSPPHVTTAHDPAVHPASSSHAAEASHLPHAVGTSHAASTPHPSTRTPHATSSPNPSIRDIPKDCKALLGPGLHFTLKGMPESVLPHRPFDMFQNKDDRDVTYKSGYDFSSCAVVGNGGTLLKTRFGPAIDSHGVVFRQNQGPTHGYAPHTGQKTTFRLLNKLWLAKYSSPRKPSWLPLEQGVTLVASRGDAGLMRRLHGKFAGSRQVAVVTMNGKASAAARHLMEQFKHRRHCAGKNNRFDGGNTPSTGLFSVTVALILCDRVTVYGFGKGRGNGPYQYYTLHGTERRKGNPVHSFTAEKALVEALAESDHLLLCDDGSPKDCGMQPRASHRGGNGGGHGEARGGQ
eukprot:jgi/Mesvir1/28160/Mv04722-RA.1